MRRAPKVLRDVVSPELGEGRPALAAQSGADATEAKDHQRPGRGFRDRHGIRDQRERRRDDRGALQARSQHEVAHARPLQVEAGIVELRVQMAAVAVEHVDVAVVRPADVAEVVLLELEEADHVDRELGARIAVDPTTEGGGQRERHVDRDRLVHQVLDVDGLLQRVEPEEVDGGAFADVEVEREARAGARSEIERLQNKARVRREVVLRIAARERCRLRRPSGKRNTGREDAAKHFHPCHEIALKRKTELTECQPHKTVTIFS